MKVVKYALENCIGELQAQNAKNANYFFYKIIKKTEMEAFAFCVISFEPINIQTP